MARKRTSSYSRADNPNGQRVVQIKVKGLAGLTVERDACRDAVRDPRAPPPPHQVRVVVAVKENSETVGTSCISRALRPAPKESVVVRAVGEELDAETVVTEGFDSLRGRKRHVAVWYNSTVDCPTPLRQPSSGTKDLEFVISLEHEDSVSHVLTPIGVAWLTLAADEPEGKTIVDIPVRAYTPIPDQVHSRSLRGAVFGANDLSADEQKEQAVSSFRSTYQVDATGDAVLRIEVEVSPHENSGDDTLQRSSSMTTAPLTPTPRSSSDGKYWHDEPKTALMPQSDNVEIAYFDENPDSALDEAFAIEVESVALEEAVTVVEPVAVEKPVAVEESIEQTLCQTPPRKQVGRPKNVTTLKASEAYSPKRSGSKKTTDSSERSGRSPPMIDDHLAQAAFKRTFTPKMGAGVVRMLSARSMNSFQHKTDAHLPPSRSPKSKKIGESWRLRKGSSASNRIHMGQITSSLSPASALALERAITPKTKIGDFKSLRAGSSISSSRTDAYLMASDTPLTLSRSITPKVKGGGSKSNLEETVVASLVKMDVSLNRSSTPKNSLSAGSVDGASVDGTSPKTDAYTLAPRSASPVNWVPTPKEKFGGSTSPSMDSSGEAALTTDVQVFVSESSEETEVSRSSTPIQVGESPSRSTGSSPLVINFSRVSSQESTEAVIIPAELQMRKFSRSQVSADDKSSVGFASYQSVEQALSRYVVPQKPPAQMARQVKEQGMPNKKLAENRKLQKNPFVRSKSLGMPKKQSFDSRKLAVVESDNEGENFSAFLSEDDDESFVTEDETFMTVDDRATLSGHPANQLFGLIDGLACGQLREMVEASFDGDDGSVYDLTVGGDNSTYPESFQKKQSNLLGMNLFGIAWDEIGYAFGRDGSLTSQSVADNRRRSFPRRDSASVAVESIADTAEEKLRQKRRTWKKAYRMLAANERKAKSVAGDDSSASSSASMEKKEDVFSDPGTWDNAILSRFASEEQSEPTYDEKKGHVERILANDEKKHEEAPAGSDSYRPDVKGRSNMATQDDSLNLSSDDTKDSDSWMPRLPEGVSQLEHLDGLVPVDSPKTEGKVVLSEDTSGQDTKRRPVPIYKTSSNSTPSATNASSTSPKSLMEFPQSAEATPPSHALTDALMGMVACSGVLPPDDSYTRKMPFQVGSPSIPTFLETDDNRSVGELTATTHEMRIDLEGDEENTATSPMGAESSLASKINEAAKGFFGFVPPKKDNDDDTSNNRVTQYQLDDAAEAALAKKLFHSSLGRARLGSQSARNELRFRTGKGSC